MRGGWEWRRPVLMAVALAIPPILLYLYVRAEYDNTVAKTRSLARQVRAATDPEQAIQRMFIKYRLPEGIPDRQEWMLGSLFYRLRDFTLATAEYGDRAPLECDDGKTRPHKQVICKGKTAGGDSREIRVEWVQYKGSWYVEDWSVPGERRPPYPGDIVPAIPSR
jgi:hypothetical protein